MLISFLLEFHSEACLLRSAGSPSAEILRSSMALCTGWTRLDTCGWNEWSPVVRYICHGDFQLGKWGYPSYGWCLWPMENPNLNWMMTGGTPNDYGTPLIRHVSIFATKAIGGTTATWSLCAGLGHLWPNAVCHQLSRIPAGRWAATGVANDGPKQVSLESHGITIRTSGSIEKLTENMMESSADPLRFRELIVSDDTWRRRAKALLLFAARKVTKDWLYLWYLCVHIFDHFDLPSPSESIVAIESLAEHEDAKNCQVGVPESLEGNKDTLWYIATCRRRSMFAYAKGGCRTRLSSSSYPRCYADAQQVIEICMDCGTCSYFRTINLWRCAFLKHRYSTVSIRPYRVKAR